MEKHSFLNQLNLHSILLIGEESLFFDFEIRKLQQESNITYVTKIDSEKKEKYTLVVCLGHVRSLSIQGDQNFFSYLKGITPSLIFSSPVPLPQKTVSPRHWPSKWIQIAKSQGWDASIQLREQYWHNGFLPPEIRESLLYFHTTSIPQTSTSNSIWDYYHPENANVFRANDKRVNLESIYLKLWDKMPRSIRGFLRSKVHVKIKIKLKSWVLK